MKGDVAAWTAAGYRLTGTAAHRAVTDDVIERLSGVERLTVLVQEFPAVRVVDPAVEFALEVDGEAVRVEAMRPNVLGAVELPGGGETWSGTLADRRGWQPGEAMTDVSGRLVVVDAAGRDGWERAFAAGAAGVLVVGDLAEAGAGAAWHTAVPWGLPRFWVEALAVDDGAEVTLRRTGGGAAEEVVTGRNVVVHIAGRGDGSLPEAERQLPGVVGVRTDSWGVVPVRSAGARRAANVAGLVRWAERFAADPPRRDVWLLFHDGGAQRHRGARFFYDAVTMSGEEHAAIVREHAAEDEWLTEVAAGLDELDAALSAGRPTPALDAAVRGRLRNTADAGRADVEAERRRVRQRGGDTAVLADRLAGWDRLRRWLYGGAAAEDLAAGDRDRLGRLVEIEQANVAQRRDELADARLRDAQRSRLREVLGGGADELTGVALHLDLDLSGGTAAWSAVTGDWTDRRYGVREPRAEADAPGYHARVLGVLADLGEGLSLRGLDVAALRDPALAEAFLPGRFEQAGSVAGAYGFLHAAWVTGHDARVRDGTPGDGVAALDFARLEAQLDAAFALTRAAFDAERLPARSGFASVVNTKRTGWDGRRPTGDLVTRRVSGGLAENRPADGAVVALWPGAVGSRDTAWRALGSAGPHDSVGFDLSPVNAHGRFAVVGLRQDIDDQLAAFAVRRDGAGRVTDVPTQETLTQYLGAAMRVDLMAANPHGYMWYPAPGSVESASAGDSGAQASDSFRVLRAGSDAEFRDNRALVGAAGRARFWWLSERAAAGATPVKVFESGGAVVLGLEEGGGPERATGVALSNFRGPASWAERSAAELWRLNESRLGSLRRRGVSSPDLEALHASAGVEDGSARAEVSWRVYPELRGAMDDLVRAVVVLMLLTVPFAFAVERLVVGAAGVYGRIAGFAVAFGVTFAVLYLTHPGFAVASTPAMIFLAFAIVLLSSLVIWVLVSKFRSELAAAQARGGASSDMPEGSGEGGRASPGSSAVQGQASGGGGWVTAAGAAGGMGVSTMRRRPTRTVLTLATVTVLTFTVLCFASVRSTVGVRSTALGPVGEAMPGRAVLLRRADAGAMPAAVLDGLPGGGHTMWAAGWWRLPSAADDRPIVVANPATGASARLGGVMGLDPAGLRAWPMLAAVFGRGAGEDTSDPALDAVWLPEGVIENLGLSPGDSVRIDGRSMTLGGATDAAALTRLRGPDDRPWRPVDVEARLRDAARGGAAGGNASDTSGGGERRLTAARVAVASNAAVRRLGGSLHQVTGFVDDTAEPGRVGRDALLRAGAVPGAVPGAGAAWVTAGDGASRLTFGRTTRVDGLWSLGAPVLLGGLIIFGTLLGSITDRQREVYTFSALGLGPRHVGLLFLAEAAVYAVVGGLGGQLLAQLVAAAAGGLAAVGWIEPLSINFASTQALFAIGLVMLTVMVSAVYPAFRAARSANPGLARTWSPPTPSGDELDLIFPFTVSAYDLAGVAAYLAEHFGLHADAGLGPFAASDVAVDRDPEGRVRLSVELALAPFDLGVTQHLTLTGRPSDIPGVEEVALSIVRRSGTRGDWTRANRVFLGRLRRQFLVWRTLPAPAVEAYRAAARHALADAPETPGSGVAVA
ncbi:MAG: ABC transporter permease [Planctomycetota bacterium]